MFERPEEPTATNAHRPSVLIVDDQPTIRTVLTSVLSGHGGFDVADAEDGIAALARIDQCYSHSAKTAHQAAALDLLVLDILMPKLTGLDVIEAMRWSYDTPPRTMVISALDDEEHVAEALRLGAIDYLPKPIDAGMFLHRVQTLCSPSAPTCFHWAPLAKLPTVRLGDYSAEAKAISESGIIVQAGPQERPAIGDVVELASPVFDECGIERQVRGRVVRVTTLRGRRTMELSFVGLHERDLCGIRRFSVRH
jgi:DNA-binding response OmpR family regulator